MAYNITSGPVFDGIELKSDQMHILSGGIANSTTVMESGTVHISSGGLASNTVVNGWNGTIIVSEGGWADTVSLKGGSVDILSGGTATAVDAVGGGVAVASGGTLSGSFISSGTLHLYAGASFFDVTMSSGTELNGFKLLNNSSFDSTEQDGWEISDVVIGSSVTANLYANQIANSAAVRMGNMHISSGGVANITTVTSYSYLHISSGGVANNTTAIGINWGSAYVYVYDGGVANNTTAEGYGCIFVCGGVANSTTVDGGELHISAGGSADTVIMNGGNGYISNGGAANSVTMTAGTLTVSNGGTASDITVSSAAKVYVNGGGTVEKANISGGMLYVSNGASAQIDYWKPCEGRVVYDYESATVNFASRYDGVWYLDAGGEPVVVKSTGLLDERKLAGTVYVMSGGITSKVELFNGSKFIWNTGSANDTTILSSGHLHISSGGVASGAKVTSGGSLFVSMGGSAIDIDWAPCVGHLTIKNGAVVTFKNSYSGAYLGSDNNVISSNTLFVGKQVASGGSVYAMNGGVISSGTVAGSMYVFSGGKTEQVNISRGTAHVYFGGEANSTTVEGDYHSGGYLNIYSGGEANNTTVNSYGYLNISSGGVANSTKVNYSGYLYISSGGVANNTTVEGRYNYGYGYLYISSGGVANSTTVNNYGYLYISSGGVANSTTMNDGYLYISSGGVANSTTVSYGALNISSGGVANSTTVNRGYFNISSGGVANSTTVNSDGGLYISSGGVHRGSLNITYRNADVYAYQGAVIDFTVAEAVPEGAYLINDLSRIDGSPSYTITVNADQTQGIYNLAQGAGKLNDTTLTIGSSPTSFTNITVNGDTVTLNDIKYTLKQKDGNLALVVGEVSLLAAPTYTLTPAEGWTNADVVITAVFDKDSVTNEYSLNDGSSWQAVGSDNTITVSNNATVLLRSTDSNGFFSPVTTVSVSSIDKEKPVIELAAETPENFVAGITITVTATDNASGIAKIEYSLDNKEWITLEGNSYYAVANGKVYFRATDNAGMVSDVKDISISKIDVDKPTLLIEGVPTEITEESVVLNITAADSTSGIDKVEYSIDGGEFLSVALEQGKGSVTIEKNASVTVRAYDKAGQFTEETVIIDKIEKDAPVISITSTHDSWTNAAVVTVSATAVDDASGVKSIEYWNGNEWVAGSSVNVTENNSVVTFRATDNTGKSSEKSYTVDFIDRDAPTVSITGNSEKPAKNLTLKAEASDSASGIVSIQYSLDNLNWIDGSSVPVSKNGTVHFKVTDAAGNVTTLSERVTVIDDVRPSITVTGNPTVYQEGYAVLHASAIDDNTENVVVYFSLDNQASWQQYSGENPCIVTHNQTVYFKASDEVGNVSVKEIVVDKIDNDDPDLVITGNTGEWTNTAVVLTAKASDASSPITKVEYRLGENGEWIEGSSVSVTVNTTVYFKATDSMGHSTIESMVIDKIDNVLPQAPHVTADITDWTNKDVTVSAEFDVNSVKNEYSVNGGEYQAYTSGVVMSENGTIDFRSTDIAGNMIISTYSVSNIDKVLPTLSLNGITGKQTRRAVTVSVNASDDASGVYAIAYTCDNINWHIGNSVTFTQNGSVTFGVVDKAGNVSMTTAVVDNIISSKADSNLLDNGTSQITGFDAAQGKVGFIAVNGETAPQWQGVWEWNSSEKDMWRVAAVGNFSGSTTQKDGLLLHNTASNTLCAWTDLGRGDYGYVNLTTLDSSFSAVATVDLGGKSYDDILVKDENGSFGVVIDGTEYHDIWHVSEGEFAAWEFYGTGKFEKFTTLIAKNRYNNHLALWANNDATFETWDWSVKTLSYLGNDLEFAAVGDFYGDGIDDIIIRNKHENSLWMWDDGDVKKSHWVVTPEQGFAVEAVGDYNGDGMDDLLVREYNTGWGGLGYYAFGSDQLWNDLNARIETDLESKFAVIA